ncbi:hypothetical protein PVAND_000268 [Polypedilum vanderplanki]|uniref:Fucosyltransferase n=1 Tax=Polypedilum vanderplanki TaxID=319348 RepID=A0A9J6BKF1_POLVA|nr:hypothetical protein PVAND_000268 [Polypedilum vanderplanki]
MSHYSDRFKLGPEKNVKPLSLSTKGKKFFTYLLIASIVILFYFASLRNFTADENIFLRPFIVKPKPMKNILFWSKYFGDTTWYSGSDEAGKEVLKSVECPVTNCFFTHDYNFLDNVTKFDAIAFHGPELIRNIVPLNRNQNQIYIFVDLEAPTAVRDLSEFENFFNLTMHYRLDSDIEFDYGKVVAINSVKAIAPSKNPNWMKVDEDFYDEEFLKIFEKKKKNIAWFVSHCETFSRRELLVEHMQNFTTIDIYGQCGPFKCPRFSDKCSKMLTDDYKFYLSFENSLCDDYVTEKLFNSMTEFVIPIVFNGANMNNFLPPKSYINANDFETVEDLVDYLNFLSENPKEYIKYFWWRQYYKILPHPVFSYALCDICKKLNDENFIETRHIYTDLNSWFRDKKCNQQAHIKFRNL